MHTWEAISASKHAKLNWRAKDHFEFASKRQVVEVLVSELSRLLPHYVFSFVLKDEKFHLVALLGFGDVNYYVTADYKWLGEAIPAAIRSFPFLLGNSKSDEKIFCIDKAYLTDNKEATPLFTELGELTNETAEVFNFLQSCEQNRRATAIAVEALAESELIEPWLLNVSNSNGEEHNPIAGLYKISEEKLNTISRSSLAKLRDKSALTIAYAQLFSLNQLHQLSLRSEILLQQETETKSKVKLGDIFEDGGSLSFDSF